MLGLYSLFVLQNYASRQDSDWTHAACGHQFYITCLVCLFQTIVSIFICVKYVYLYIYIYIWHLITFLEFSGNPINSIINIVYRRRCNVLLEVECDPQVPENC